MTHDAHDVVDPAVTRLSITPVKGLSLHHPASIDLTVEGAVCDRAFYLVDDTGTLQSCTHNPGLFGLVATYDEESHRLAVEREGEVLIDAAAEPATPVDTDMYGLRTLGADVVADPVWSDFFSDAVGRRVHLLRARGSAYDVHPVTLVGTASIASVARHAAVPGIDPRRFRMLIELSGGEPYVEDTWDGTLLEVGDAVLRGGGRVKRCAATTRDPESGTVDLQTLRMIMAHRGRQTSELGVGAHLGVYAEVVQPGTVSVGDTLRVRADA